MEVKCEYCNSMIPDDVPECPNCGAPNVNMHRTSEGTPQTIEQLAQWYQDRHLPPYETTRFFIGIDCKEPRAFGIYKDGEEYIVYKNKSSGERAVRYHGKDEAYAVNEILMKLKSEILSQKASQKPHQQTVRPHPSQSANNSGRGCLGCALPSLKMLALIVVGVFVLICIGMAIFDKPSTSYYSYNGVPYVSYGNNYYSYNYDTNNYDLLEDDEVPYDLYHSSDDYQVNDSSNHPYFSAPDSSSSYSSGNDYSWNSSDSWSDNSYFDSNDDYDFNWDSNDSWDSGGWDSWDSGGSSWDDDW